MRKKISSLAIALSLIGLFAFTNSQAEGCDWEPTSSNTDRGLCVQDAGGGGFCDTEFDPPYYNCTVIVTQQ